MVISGHRSFRHSDRLSRQRCCRCPVRAHSGEDPRSYLRDIAQDSAGEAISHGYTVMRRMSKTVDDGKAFVSNIADTAGRRLLRGAT